MLTTETAAEPELCPNFGSSQHCYQEAFGESVLCGEKELVRKLNHLIGFRGISLLPLRWKALLCYPKFSLKPLQPRSQRTR
jgi:hypothetical protein